MGLLIDSTVAICERRRGGAGLVQGGERAARPSASSRVAQSDGVDEKSMEPLKSRDAGEE